MTTDPTEIARALAGQFTILREIGHGGMGVVYLARDDKLDRPVALKVLPSAASDTVARERFLREGRTAARLAHPNIVPIYRADEMGGIAFFTMAFVDGESLADRVRDRGPLQPADAVRILREVAWALAYAHARGVVHRDVKPENVLLERPTGRALVTDFGIARTAESVSGEQLTQAGAILGTLQYMSPEQVAGETLDGRSDLYSLGVVAFYMLSGRLPFGDLSGSAVIVAHATRQPPSLRDVASGVPAPLASVVDRCLSKSPDDRYATGEALADALERALAEVPAQSAAAVADERSSRLSEAEANAIWRRAAQLQADALRRLESRSDLLTQPSSATSASAPSTMSESPSADDSGYAIAHVVAAAQEAGISNQYVAMAMAERPQSKSGAVVAAGDANLGVSERTATLYLGTQERSLAVTHIVEATPARTLRALGTVLQQMPYQLKFRETVGAHPLDGGVMVFDLPDAPLLARGAQADALNTYWMGTARQLVARQVHVTLRRLPGDEARTEVTMTCDLRTGVRRNVRASQWFASIIGAGAAFASGVLATSPVTVVGAGLGMAALTFAWYRWLYPGVFEKARGEMENALVAVGAVVRSEDVFGALPRDTP